MRVQYGEPFHGLALFKHHNPLHFSFEQLADLLAVASDWFLAAQAAHRQDMEAKGQLAQDDRATGNKPVHDADLAQCWFEPEPDGKKYCA